MADNTQLNASTTVGDVIATDDVGGVKYQRVKVSIGADGAAADVHDGNPLPVDDAGGSLTVDDGGASLTVDGTVAVSSVGGSVAVTGPLTDTELRATPVAVSDGGASLTVDGTVGVSGTVTVDGSGVTQPVSGTVTANQGGAWSATVTQGTASNLKAQVQVIDGAGDSAMDDANNALRVNVVAGGAGDGAILDGVSATIKATVLDYVNSNPLAVRLTDTNGDYVTAGGGTQYADGAASGGPTGTLAMGYDGANVQALATDASGNLQVDVLTMPTVTVQDGGGAITVDGTVGISGSVTVTDGAGSLTVDGTVTANAGTGFAPVVTDGSAAGTTGIHVLGTDGANAQILKTDAAGELQVDVLSMPTTTVTGTVTANAGTGFAPVVTDGSAAGTTGIHLLGTDGTNAQIIKTDTAGELQVDVLTMPTVTVTDGAGSLTVDGTVTANLAAGTNNIGDVDVLTVPAPLSTTGNGTASTALRVTVASDSTGTVAVTNSALQVGANSGAKVEGCTVHDNPDAGNPVKIGFKAETALPTAVADNDRVNGVADRYGRQLVSHVDPAMSTWKSANYTTQQTGAAIWTPTAGTRVAITSIVVGSYGTTTGRLILWFGASADTTYSAGTDQLVLAASFAPGTSSKPGLVFTPAVPVFASTTDHVLRITTDAALSVDVAVHGYEFTP